MGQKGLLESWASLDSPWRFMERTTIKSSEGPLIRINDPHVLENKDRVRTQATRGKNPDIGQTAGRGYVWWVKVSELFHY